MSVTCELKPYIAYHTDLLLKKRIIAVFMMASGCFIPLAIQPTAEVAVNTIFSEDGFIQEDETSYLVRAGNEFGIDCITGSHFNASWYYGSPSVKG